MSTEFHLCEISGGTEIAVLEIVGRTTRSISVFDVDGEHIRKFNLHVRDGVFGYTANQDGTQLALLGIKSVYRYSTGALLPGVLGTYENHKWQHGHHILHLRGLNRTYVLRVVHLLNARSDGRIFDVGVSCTEAPIWEIGDRSAHDWICKLPEEVPTVTNAIVKLAVCAGGDGKSFHFAFPSGNRIFTAWPLEQRQCPAHVYTGRHCGVGGTIVDDIEAIADYNNRVRFVAAFGFMYVVCQQGNLHSINCPWWRSSRNFLVRHCIHHQADADTEDAVRACLSVQLATGYWPRDLAAIICAYATSRVDIYTVDSSGALEVYCYDMAEVDRCVPPPCAACRKPSKARCGRCRAEWYCSKACQSSHWAVHKPECREAPKTGDITR